jgi:hypothetical protein
VTHLRVRLLKYARAHTNIYVHTQARTYVRTYGTHVHTYVPIRINVRCVENVAQYLRAYVRTYVCIRTRICVQLYAFFWVALMHRNCAHRVHPYVFDFGVLPEFVA